MTTIKTNLWYDVFFHDENRAGFAEQRPQYVRWTRMSKAVVTEDTDGHSDPMALATALESSLRADWAAFVGREFRVRVYRAAAGRVTTASPVAERVFST